MCLAQSPVKNCRRELLKCTDKPSIPTVDIIDPGQRRRERVTRMERSPYALRRRDFSTSVAASMSAAGASVSRSWPD